MRVHAFIPESFVDGPGVRAVVFFQGCPHGCVGCHNPDTHDYDSLNASDLAVEDVVQVFDLNPYLAGVTFSGGEPFSERNLFELCAVARQVLDRGKSVWAFTGYTMTALIKYLNSLPVLEEGKSNAMAVLSCIQVLVDGPFCLNLRDTSLRFRGSANQRLIDVVRFLEGYSEGMSDADVNALADACALS